MQESYGEGPASHTGSESCAIAREGGGEALTGGRAGRVLSRENRQTPGRRRRGGKRKALSAASLSRDAAESRAVADPEHARTHLAREPGEPRAARPRRRAASGSPRTHADDERPGAVAQAHSTDEVSEQRWATPLGSASRGGDGGKGPGQGEPEPARHSPDTVPGCCATGAGSGTSSRRAVSAARRHTQGKSRMR
jgi:hypothetical protein